MRGLGLGFTNTVAPGVVLDVCLLSVMWVVYVWNE